MAWVRDNDLCEGGAEIWIDEASCMRNVKLLGEDAAVDRLGVELFGIGEVWGCHLVGDNFRDAFGLCVEIVVHHVVEEGAFACCRRCGSECANCEKDREHRCVVLCCPIDWS